VVLEEEEEEMTIMKRRIDDHVHVELDTRSKTQSNSNLVIDSWAGRTILHPIQFVDTVDFLILEGNQDMDLHHWYFDVVGSLLMH